MNNSYANSFDSKSSAPANFEDMPAGTGCGSTILIILITLASMGGFAYYKQQKAQETQITLQKEQKRTPQKTSSQEKENFRAQQEKQKEKETKLLGETLQKLESSDLKIRQEALQTIRKNNLVGALYPLKSLLERETNIELVLQIEELIPYLESLTLKRNRK